MRMGTMVAAIYNVNRKPGAKPLTWRDFFGNEEMQQEEVDKRTPEQIEKDWVRVITVFNQKFKQGGSG